VETVGAHQEVGAQVGLTVDAHDDPIHALIEAGAAGSETDTAFTQP
jgi:hypothetical protein